MCVYVQNSEMLLHLRENVRRTLTHAIEVEEKVPLEQVLTALVSPLSSVYTPCCVGDQL